MFWCRITVLSTVVLMVLYISLCNGSCVTYKSVTGLRGCLGEDIFVPFGIVVQLVPCLRCECHSNGELSCCSMRTRYSYPDYCMEIPIGPCKTLPVMKHNKSIICDRFGGNGK